AGPPGIALLLLRVSVGLVLFIDQCGRLAWPAPMWLLAAAVLAALAVSLGVLTPLFALVCGLFKICSLAHATLIVAPPVLLALLLAVSVAMLGPGAYSLDARMFGRRVVLLPPQRQL